MTAMLFSQMLDVMMAKHNSTAAEIQRNDVVLVRMACKLINLFKPCALFSAQPYRSPPLLQDIFGAFRGHPQKFMNSRTSRDQTFSVGLF